MDLRGLLLRGGRRARGEERKEEGKEGKRRGKRCEGEERGKKGNGFTHYYSTTLVCLRK